MRLQLTALWYNTDFRKLWVGQTISLFGSQMTSFALPLMAVINLQATPVQMGFLGGVEFAPFLLISLFAGVWVDYLPRRAILIWGNIGRALLLLSIPTAAYFSFLRMEYLYIVAFCVGVFTVFFDLSYQAFLPSLVKHQQLVEANSKLQVSESLAKIVGPGLASSLVELVSAPLIIAFDGLSFLLSALLFCFLRTPELKQPEFSQRPNICKEISEGLRIVLRNPFLRSIAYCTSTNNLFDQMILVLYFIYLTRYLKINPNWIGVFLSMGAFGYLMGALLTKRITRCFGLGRTIVGSRVIKGCGAMLIPLANGSLLITVPFLVTAMFLQGFTGMIFNINQISLRQTIVPIGLQGRMNASMRFIMWGTIPLGSMLGGVLGEAFGVRATITVGAFGTLFAFLWLFFSPVYTLRDLPTSIE